MEKSERFVYGQYFFGQKISDYGLSQGYVDYKTLYNSFDAVMNNDILNATSEIGYWEQVSGEIDNSDEIEELKEKIDDIESQMEVLIDDGDEDSEAYKELERNREDIQIEIENLEYGQDYPPEIYQYFIVSDEGVGILRRYTDDPLFYNEKLDMYVSGVCHYGTLWDYVLTDIECICEEKSKAIA